jgi:hypothetical protein
LLDANVERLNDSVFSEKVVMEILKDATVLTHVMSTKKPDTFVSGFVLLPLLEKVAVLPQ